MMTFSKIQTQSKMKTTSKMKATSKMKTTSKIKTTKKNDDDPKMKTTTKTFLRDLDLVGYKVQYVVLSACLPVPVSLFRLQMGRLEAT